MTKNELIENLKCHQEQTSLFDKKVSIVTVVIFVIFFLLAWLNLFESVADPEIILSAPLLIFLIFCGVLSSRHEKINDTENSMYCISCEKRFHQNTFPIAVLENKCQECGAKIYDT